MKTTKIRELVEFGQSVWLDYISRSLIDSGRLGELIDMGLVGMTSNPTIFDKAISSGSDYDSRIAELNSKGRSTFEIYDDLTVKDVQDAADIFRPVYEKTQGLDGYVSLEINPQLAFKTPETIGEGKRLHQKVDRPNVMFKVPSTKQGLKAVEELTASGININVTLIFSLKQYIDTAQSYIRGIKRFLQDNGDTRKVHSVASVFVSRIDTAVDRILDGFTAEEKDASTKRKLASLRGEAAVANSGLIYGKHLEIFSPGGFKEIHDKGVNPVRNFERAGSKRDISNGVNIQRVLWGSTSTKDPAYSDLKYVTELIAKNTVNTVPQKTIEAFLDHGTVEEALTGDTRKAQKIINELRDIGIDINGVCAKLLDDGVSAFVKSFDSLLSTIEEKSRNLCRK